MDTQSLILTLPKRSKTFLPVESRDNAFPIFVASLDHQDPQKKPNDTSKLISATVVLRWSDSPFAPGFEAWRESIMFINETSEDQRVGLRITLLSGGFDISKSKLSAPESLVP